MFKELPPTAGLPLRWSDFFPGAATFENDLASFIGVEKVSLFSSGTAALIVALKTLKRLAPERFEVVVPAYTCPLVVIACAQVGLTVRLCDLSPDSYEMDEEALREACNRNTLCVVPTHLAGLPCRMEPIISAARACGAYVLEDAAQSLGATYKGGSVGLTGDIAFFSLTAGKGLTIYEGGFLCSEKLEILNLITEVSALECRSDVSAELSACLHLVGYKLFYNPCGLRIVYGAALRYHLQNGKIDAALQEVFPRAIPVRSVSEFRKTVGASALKRLPAFINENAERARIRAGQIAQIKGLRVLSEIAEATGSFPVLVLLFESASQCQKVLQALWTKGLGVTKLFAYDLTGYQYLNDVVDREVMPEAASFAARTISISNSSYVSDEYFAEIMKSIHEITSLAD